MSFTVKATYGYETRKLVFDYPSFPSYEQLYHQVSSLLYLGNEPMPMRSCSSTESFLAPIPTIFPDFSSLLPQVLSAS